MSAKISPDVAISLFFTASQCLLKLIWFIMYNVAMVDVTQDMD